MQQAYLAVVEGSAHFDGNASLKTWLYAVIRNTARRYQRTQQQQRGLLDRLRQTESPVDQVNESDVEPQYSNVPVALRQAMKKLPARQKQVLELVIDADFTLEQAASVLGVSLGSARTHYHRAKQSLRSELENIDGSL